MATFQDDFLRKAAAAASAAGHPFPEYAACEAALESAWGQSGLATRANNLFGQKQSRPPLDGTGTLSSADKRIPRWQVGHRQRELGALHRLEHVLQRPHATAAGSKPKVSALRRCIGSNHRRGICARSFADLVNGSGEGKQGALHLRCASRLLCLSSVCSGATRKYADSRSKS